MIYNPKIYIDKSPVHGWGVFAKEDIMEGEVFEECPVLTLPIEKGEVTSLLIDYRFNWPQGVEWQEQVIAFGYGYQGPKSRSTFPSDRKEIWRENVILVQGYGSP